MARQVQPLTVAGINALKPEATDYRVADGRGLYLRISPAGRKSWLFRYRQPGSGKYTNWAFGRYPDVGLSDARAAAADYRVMVKAGKEPQAQHAAKIEDAKVTLEIAARRWD